MDKDFTTYYIVRHGQTEANANQIVDGHFNTPLTALGRQQAEALAEQLAVVNFSAAFSSDLSRAFDTIAPTATAQGLAIVRNNLLRERFFADFEGATYEQFADACTEIFEKVKHMTSEEYLQVHYQPGIESDAEMIVRGMKFLTETTRQYPGKTILVGCHGGLMRALLQHIGWADHRTLPHDCIDNAGYAVLQTNGATFTISDSHGIHINADATTT